MMNCVNEEIIVDDKTKLIKNKHISERIYWLRVLLIYFMAFIAAELIGAMNYTLLLMTVLFVLIVYVLRHNNNRGDIRYDVFLIFNFIMTFSFIVLFDLLYYDRISLVSIPITAGYSLYSLLVYYLAEKDLPSATTLIWKFILGTSFFIIVPFIAYVFIFTIV